MARAQVFALALLLVYLLCQSSLAMPSTFEEPFVDREYNSALLNWLATQELPQHLNNICKAFVRNLNSAPMPKRNSELINSLLSLPKNMNDAGK